MCCCHGRARRWKVKPCRNRHIARISPVGGVSLLGPRAAANRAFWCAFGPELNTERNDCAVRVPPTACHATMP